MSDKFLGFTEADKKTAPLLFDFIANLQEIIQPAGVFISVFEIKNGEYGFVFTRCQVRVKEAKEFFNRRREDTS